MHMLLITEKMNFFNKLRTVLNPKSSSTYNAVVEGTSYYLDWEERQFKLTELDISEEVVILRHDDNRYRLVAEAQGSVVHILKNPQGAIQLIPSLYATKGLVARSMPPTNILDIPRAVFMQDGRIFLEDQVVQNQWFMETFNDELWLLVRGFFIESRYRNEYKHWAMGSKMNNFRG